LYLFYLPYFNSQFEFFKHDHEVRSINHV
jgi:hypothetical protein